MKTKKNVLVSLSVFIAVVFIFTLFGQQPGPPKKRPPKKAQKGPLWDKLNDLESRIVTMEEAVNELSSQGGQQEFPTDYTNDIIGTWVGITYSINWANNLEEDSIKEWEPITITFEDPDGDGIGVYLASPRNPFIPFALEWYGDDCLAGEYQIKGDLLGLVIPTGGSDPDPSFITEILEIQGDKVIWGGVVNRGFYEKQ